MKEGREAGRDMKAGREAGRRRGEVRGAAWRSRRSW